MLMTLKTLYIKIEERELILIEQRNNKKDRDGHYSWVRIMCSWQIAANSLMNSS